MDPNPKKLSGLSRLLLFACAAMLVYSIFVPLWRIELDAPQYPEGLELLIHPHKLGGNVEIINGLNHYIGMRELHTDDFVEFKILPYIIGAFALASLIVTLIARKKGLYILLTCFVLFGIVSMIDFYKWEYEYGHDLNPHAAIIVPGQAYQPPLIGFKQLLNFGAYSMPALGGWLFVASGLLMVFAVLMEKKVYNRLKRSRVHTAALLLPFLMMACGETSPQAVKLNQDNCDYCKMTIADLKFAAQTITDKGRIYKFDDLSCLQAWSEENESSAARSYVADYLKPDSFLEVQNASYVTSPKVNSPMGGNMAAFATREDATSYSARVEGTVSDWQSLKK